MWHHFQSQDNHGFIYKLLMFLLAGSTIKFLLMLKSPRIYKRFLDKLFNIKVKLFGNEVTVYFLIVAWVIMLSLIFFCKYTYYY